MASDQVKMQALLPTTEDIPDIQWDTSDSRLDCKFNIKMLDQKISPDKRSKWSLAKVYGFKEWCDRITCSAVADAKFVFVKDSDNQFRDEFPFSLSFAFSKSMFFGADARWRSAQKASSEGITFIESNLTEDPRVLNLIVFNLYTDLLLDVHTLTHGSCDADTLLSLPNQFEMVSRPVIQCDLLEVYKVAHFLGMGKLLSKLAKYCLMPGSIACPCETLEMRLACLIARCQTCEDSGELELVKQAAKTYVKHTGGLACLVRWPLVYSREKWDILLSAGKDTAHHWFAHVVPLYVYIFFAPEARSVKDILSWASELGLAEAAKKPLGSHLTGVDMKHFLESTSLGTLCLERSTTIPHVRSLVRYYKVKMHFVKTVLV